MRRASLLDHLIVELRLPTSTSLVEAIQIAQEFVQRAERIKALVQGIERP